jgi:hypothetical protein
MTGEVSPDTINQIAHILAGMLGVLGPIALFSKKAKEYAIIGIMLVAAIKEFVFDGWINHVQPFFGNASAFEDFAFFGLGTALAVLLYWLSQKYNW